MELLGDFGGFNDALFMLVGLVSSFYGAQMYQAAIARELKYQNKKQNKKKMLDPRVEHFVAKVNDYN